MTSIHVRADEGTRYSMIDGDHVHKTAVEGYGGAFEVFEIVTTVAEMAPPHVSPWTGVLYLLEGRTTAMVDGAPYDVEPGELVVFPAGKPATFQLVGESARFLAITSGHGAGRFFAELSAAVKPGAPDAMDEVLAVTRRHGVALAGA